MDWNNIHQILLIIQHAILCAGIFIILSGIIVAFCQYFYYLVSGQLATQGAKINVVRLNLGRVLILGLEFIVAADLIATTTTPDYYTIGIVAIIVVIRTLLSYSLNREIQALGKET